MANLAQIAGLYSFLLVDWQSAADSTVAVTAVGIVWIAIMTAITTIGIELSAKTQVGLLGAEVITLVLFAVVALAKVAFGTAPPHRVDPSINWLNPFAIDSFDALVSGVLLGVFIYWGWDSTVTVNEESKDSSEGPGKAALLATVILLAIYIVVAYAAQAFGGTAAAHRQRRRRAQRPRRGRVRQSARQDPDHRGADVGGRLDADDDPADRAHVAVDGARARRCPRSFGEVHPRYLTPHVSTILMGVLSIIWYVGLTIISENILFDSLAALGLMIAFYYGLTGFACTIYYRRELRQEREERPAHRGRAAARRHHPARDLREVGHRLRGPGELGVGRLLVRPRPAARHRDLLPHHGPRAHVLVALHRRPRVLAAAAGGRRSRDRVGPEAGEVDPELLND